VSLLEDQTRAANAEAKEANRLAEMDYRIEMVKQSLPKDPRVDEFKKRRTAIAMQVRWWKPSTIQVLPIRRQLR
jgi:hypothetical protein